jgi:hypothetical protein
MAWRPNFRLNYWLCLGIAAIGGGGAVYGLIIATYWLFPAGCGIAILALAVTRLKGRAKIPIPGMDEPLEGDFAPIGDPPEEKVTVEPTSPEQPPKPAPPQE